MAEGTGDYQEEVLSDLLDLQAELRGEMRDPATEPAATAAPARERDVVTVAASGLQVTVAPTGAAVTERLAALNARLSRLEDGLASVTKRIDGVGPEDDVPAEPPGDVDARWRSFIDLQRIVADRLDGR
jgi:hypothetical protein